MDPSELDWDGSVSCGDFGGGNNFSLGVIVPTTGHTKLGGAAYSGTDFGAPGFPTAWNVDNVLDGASLISALRIEYAGPPTGAPGFYNLSFSAWIPLSYNPLLAVTRAPQLRYRLQAAGDPVALEFSTRNPNNTPFVSTGFVPLVVSPAFMTLALPPGPGLYPLPAPLVHRQFFIGVRVVMGPLLSGAPNTLWLHTATGTFEQ